MFTTLHTNGCCAISRVAKLARPAFISQSWICDMMTHLIAVPSSVADHRWSVFEFAHFHKMPPVQFICYPKIHIHQNDWFEYELVYDRYCRARMQTLEYPVLEHHSIRWTDGAIHSIDFGTAAWAARKKKIYVIENVMSLSERILGARRINLYTSSATDLKIDLWSISLTHTHTMMHTPMNYPVIYIRLRSWTCLYGCTRVCVSVCFREKRKQQFIFSLQPVLVLSVALIRMPCTAYM